MSLTNEDREALTWAIYDGGPSRDDFLAGIEHLVEQIVARHVAEARAAALNEAADAIDTTGSVCINAHGDQCLGGIAYRDAARIVRNLAATPPP